MKNLKKFKAKELTVDAQKQITAGNALWKNNAYGYGKSTAEYAISQFPNKSLQNLPFGQFLAVEIKFGQIRDSQDHQSDNLGCFNKGWVDTLSNAGLSYLKGAVGTTSCP